MSEMKLIMESWRAQQAWHGLQEELREWLVHENYLTSEDVKLIQEGTFSSIRNFVKRKLEDAKAWTY